MTERKYIGARYVPLFADPLQWDNVRTYEPLTVVLHDGNSYTSRQYVPAGIAITNTDYWALSADYNAAIQNIENILPISVFEQNEMTVADALDSLADRLPFGEFDAENTVKDYIDSGISFEALSSVRAFDTVANMQAADDLVAGMVCHTNGFHASGDGGAAFYKISATGTANGMDVLACGDLFATLVVADNITPELFGAYGNGANYDDAYIQRMLDYSKTNYGNNAKVSFGIGKNYKVASAINIPPYIFIDGNNCTITSDTGGFLCDGLYHTQIRNFKLKVKTHGIELTSTSTWSNYNIFDNIFAENVNSSHTGTYGIYIHNTTSYITEETFDHCVMWHFDNGIRCDNNTNTSLGSCYFIRCSTETSESIGQYLKNTSDMTFLFTRMVEAKSNIFKTEETNSHLAIYSHTTNVGNEWELSDNTNGVIFGFYRKGGLYDTSPGMAANIVGGKVIPFDNNQNPRRMNIPAGTTTIPQNDSSEIIKCFNHNQTGDPVTLNLDPNYYGGLSKVNSFIIRLNSTSVSVLTINIGSWSVNIDASQVGTARVFRFDYDMTPNANAWSITKLNYTIADAIA